MTETPTTMKAVQSSLRDEIVKLGQENTDTHTLLFEKLRDYELELKARNGEVFRF